MRSIISRKVLTAAAATGLLSLTGGFALAANAHPGTGDTPGPGNGQAHAPLSPELCGVSMDLGDYVASAVGDLCAHAAEDPDGGYGEEPGEPTHPPTKPPHTHPPTQPPHTHPPTTPPGECEEGEPECEPTTPPTTQPPTTQPPHTQPPTTPPGECEEGEPECEPTTPPTTQPPTTTPPGECEEGEPECEPTTPPGECEEPEPGQSPEPGCEPTTPTTPPGKPELPDTGSDPALWGAAAVSAALIIGGTVVQLRGGRLVRSRRH
ncbi:hypothetical protein [Streptomyces sp. NRRL F-5727]|uniref:hypothetical protein n=1 Tax=Streptomyces sp. NRRL F-5727 TaxID=1463871 RepID=UPI0004C9C6F8|nr:hypothetical protein [Streptomyces sp. NRRL F-5727]